VQIILVSRHLKAARTITIMPRHLVMALVGFVAAVFFTSAVFSWLSVHFRLPVIEDLLTSIQQKESLKTREYVTNNLQMMASRLGELQAQMLQLDKLGERLSGIAGGKPPPVAAEKAAAGGPFVPAPMSADELQHEIQRLTQVVDNKAEELNQLESKLLERRVRDRLLPTMLPVKNALLGSSYGYRSDPIANLRAMHEGIDFKADVGESVYAAADGVVVVASYHPEFGKMIDVDHGEGLLSRYTHLSRMDIQAGQIVKRGELIGAVGTTGRSTGSHLHFEVRMFGVAQNPAIFLKKNGEFAQLKHQ
jgi:murein DD-endopeptidase MepM/ murein hydrolase activator NlpD